MSDKNTNNDKPSMMDVLRGKGDRGAKVENIKLEITNALIETEAQKEIYRTAAKRAIHKAQRAVEQHNAAEKAIAYNELKFAYGVYHYMDTLHNAFRSIESQLQMQEMTQSFAHVVSSLKSIRVPASNINFNKLTATALREMDRLDFSGLDEMVNELIHGSIQATDSAHANDQFLDDLVSGKVSLDTPYTTSSSTEAPAQTENLEKRTETKPVSADEAELLAMLDQINAGLNGNP